MPIITQLKNYSIERLCFQYYSAKKSWNIQEKGILFGGNDGIQLFAVLIGGNAHQPMEHAQEIGIIIKAALIGNGIEGGIGADHFLGQHHPAIENIIIDAAVCVFHKFVGKIGSTDVKLLCKIRYFNGLGIIAVDIRQHFLHDAIGNDGAGEGFGMIDDGTDPADDALHQGIALEAIHGTGGLLHLLKGADEMEAFLCFFPGELEAVKAPGGIGTEKLIQINLAAAQHIQRFQGKVQIGPFIAFQFPCAGKAVHAKGRNDKKLIGFQQIHIVIQAKILAAVDVNINLVKIMAMKFPGFHFVINGIKGLKPSIYIGHGG